MVVVGLLYVFSMFLCCSFESWFLVLIWCCLYLDSLFRCLSWSFLPSFPSWFILRLPLSFSAVSVVVGLISWIFLCHQEIRHLVSVWRAPQFCFVVVLFYMWKKCAGEKRLLLAQICNWGGAGLVPSLVQIECVSYFSAICVMLGWKFPFISPTSSSWKKLCDVLWLPISSLYQSCLKFQIFDILRVSLA